MRFLDRLRRNRQRAALKRAHGAEYVQQLETLSHHLTQFAQQRPDTQPLIDTYAVLLANFQEMLLEKQKARELTSLPTTVIDVAFRMLCCYLGTRLVEQDEAGKQIFSLRDASEIIHLLWSQCPGAQDPLSCADIIQMIRGARVLFGLAPCEGDASPVELGRLVLGRSASVFDIFFIGTFFPEFAVNTIDQFPIAIKQERQD